MDCTADAKPTGIEITAPAQVGDAGLNGVHVHLLAPDVIDEDIAPFRAA